MSRERLVPPLGTTYTFTTALDEAGATLITFDLTAARPPSRPRPGVKPELGDVVVTTVFSVATTAPRYSTYDTTGAVATPGSYAFLSDPDDTTTAVTTYEALVTHIQPPPKRNLSDTAMLTALGALVLQLSTDRTQRISFIQIPVMSSLRALVLHS